MFCCEGGPVLRRCQRGRADAGGTARAWASPSGRPTSTECILRACRGRYRCAQGAETSGPSPAPFRAGASSSSHHPVSSWAPVRQTPSLRVRRRPLAPGVDFHTAVLHPPPCTAWLSVAGAKLCSASSALSLLSALTIRPWHTGVAVWRYLLKTSDSVRRRRADTTGKQGTIARARLSGRASISPNTPGPCDPVPQAAKTTALGQHDLPRLDGRRAPFFLSPRQLARAAAGGLREQLLLS